MLYTKHLHLMLYTKHLHLMLYTKHLHLMLYTKHLHLMLYTKHFHLMLYTEHFQLMYTKRYVLHKLNVNCEFPVFVFYSERNLEKYKVQNSQIQSIH